MDAKLILRAEQLRREEPARTTGTLVELLQAEAKAQNLEIPHIEEGTLGYRDALRAGGYPQALSVKRAGSHPRYEHKHRMRRGSATSVRASRFRTRSSQQYCERRMSMQ